MDAILYIFRKKSNVYAKYAVAANDVDAAWDRLEEYLEWDPNPVTLLTVGDCYELVNFASNGVCPL